MKKVLVLTLFLFPLLLCAQSVKKQRQLEACMDSSELNYMGERIICKRVSDKCARFLGRDDKGNTPPLAALVVLQASFNNCYRMVSNYTKEIPWNAIQKAQSDLNNTRKKYSNFNYNHYDYELDFYKTVYNKLNLERETTRRKDSVRRAINERKREDEQRLRVAKNDSITNSINEKRQSLSKRDKLEHHFTSSTHNADYYKYVTQFTDMRLNFVNIRVQNFLSANGYVEYDSNYTYATIVTSYIKKSSSTPNPLRITVKYNVEIQEETNEGIIKDCKIYGFDLYVVDFFMKFWNTSMIRADIRKKELVFYNLLEDKISLTWATKDYAEIEIKNSGEFVFNNL